MKPLTLLAALLLFGCAHDWTTADTARQAAVVGLIVIDYGQTKTIFNNPGEYRELNPLINEDNVEAFFIGSAVVISGISWMLPPKYRRWWQYFNIVTRGVCVGSNFAIGARIEF